MPANLGKEQDQKNIRRVRVERKAGVSLRQEAACKCIKSRLASLDHGLRQTQHPSDAVRIHEADGLQSFKERTDVAAEIYTGEPSPQSSYEVVDICKGSALLALPPLRFSK